MLLYFVFSVGMLSVNFFFVFSKQFHFQTREHKDPTDIRFVSLYPLLHPNITLLYIHPLFQPFLRTWQCTDNESILIISSTVTSNN